MRDKEAVRQVIGEEGVGSGRTLWGVICADSLSSGQLYSDKPKSRFFGVIISPYIVVRRMSLRVSA